MIRTAKKLAACVLMLGVLVCGTALSAAAAGLPVEAQNGVSLPWSKDVPAESISTGSYSANMLLGASQQLSPVVKPSYSTDSVVFLTDDSSVLTVSSSGVVQAVGVGTATITAAAGNQICAYTIVVSMDSSMIVTEMDLSLSSNTIYVGNSVSASLQVRPSSASNYATVTLTSSNEKIATVNSFGRVTGVAPGTATITAACGSVVATTTVTVLALPTDSTGTSGTTSSNSGQVITPSTNYIVLKPGATRTITAKATPASASQSFTFKSGNSSIATVSPSGVVTAVGTGSTSITISNGKATAMVTVIVNRSADASSGSDNSNAGTNTPDDNTSIPLDPVVQTIQDSTEDQVVFNQSEVPIVTGEILNALRTTGKTLCVVGDGYTMNVSGKNVKSTTSEIDTAITFTESEEGLEFELDNGRALPCAVQLLPPVPVQHHQQQVAVPEQLQGRRDHRRHCRPLPADQPEPAVRQYQLVLLHRRRRGCDPDRRGLHRVQEALLVLVSAPALPAYNKPPAAHHFVQRAVLCSILPCYSTVTLLARLRGLSTSQPRSTAM